MLQKEIIDAGEQMASDLIDASIDNDLIQLGCKVKPLPEYKNHDLIKKYLDHEIQSSVEAIYIAMKRAENKLTSIPCPMCGGMIPPCYCKSCNEKCYF